MQRQIATFDNGHLVLTPEVQSALGIPSDSRTEVLVGDREIRILVPEQRRLSVEEADRIIDGLRGMFAGQPSLEDEFFRARDVDKW
jgi:hypothetical protein